MARINLPSGQTLRQVAERLGVPVEQLQPHAGVTDVDAPQPTARAIDVPDGFLKGRSRVAVQHDQVAQALQPGLNSYLALDMEYRRTRSAGGLHAQAPSEDELEGLKEARRAYLRFEADSNQLAIDLYSQLTSSHSVDVRGQAYAGQSQSQSQRCRRFGEEVANVQPHALSSAKAAVMAMPKLVDAQLAMAMAVGLGDAPGSFAAAFQACERAIEVAPNDPWAWAELASLCMRAEEANSARDAAARALELDTMCPAAIEVQAEIYLKAQQGSKGIKSLQKLVQAIPTDAGAKIRLSGAFYQSGQAEPASTLLKEALSQAQTEAQRAHLLKWYSVYCSSG